MKNLTKSIWFKVGGIIFLIIALVLVISQQHWQINNFIESLPTGDIDSQKCKELVDAKNMELAVSSEANSHQAVLNSVNGSTTPPNYFDLLDSKYIYSHKLCLAEIHTIIYTSSSGAMNDMQIIDLGSNNIFAENDSISNQNNYYLYGQKQNSPIIVSDIWSKVQEMK